MIVPDLTLTLIYGFNMRPSMDMNVREACDIVTGDTIISYSSIVHGVERMTYCTVQYLQYSTVELLLQVAS